MSWTRSPLLHFLMIGLLLFVADSLRPGAGTEEERERYRIEIDASRLDVLERDFRAQTGNTPDPVDMQRLVAREVDDEILYREAVARGLLERDGGVQTRLIQKMRFLDGTAQDEDPADLVERAMQLGLHEDDLVVRRILVQKMRLYAAALAEEERPTAQAIAADYEANLNSLRAPDRISFRHVFLSADARQGETRADAEKLRGRLIEAGTAAGDAISWGDPFPLGHHLLLRSERDLARSFGVAFGVGALGLGLEPGEWSRPIESAYGYHLLWVEARETGRVPPLDAVSDRIRHRLEEDRRAEKLAAVLVDLRTRYEVVLSERPGAPGRHTSRRSEDTR